MPCTPIIKDINWRENVAGVVAQIFKKSCKRDPSESESKNIRTDFYSLLKQYFLDNEDPFDVWSGIQNIFESLDRREDWDYTIVSDYWSKPTEFILNSCGIHSRQMKLLSAEDGISPGEIIRDLCDKHQLKGDEVVYLMAKDIEMLDHPTSINRLERMAPPHKKKADMLEYPRFSKLFVSA